MGSRCWHACLSHEREGVPSSPLRLMPLRSQIQAPCFPASPDEEWSSMHRSYRLAWWGLRSHRSWCTDIQVIPASIQRTLLPALVFVETVDIVVLSLVSPPGRSTWARKPRRWDTRDVPFSVYILCGLCMLLISSRGVLCAVSREKNPVSSFQGKFVLFQLSLLSSLLSPQRATR